MHGLQATLQPRHPLLRCSGVVGVAALALFPGQAEEAVQRVIAALEAPAREEGASQLRTELQVGEQHRRAVE